ncbi:hypothetical protein Ctob_006892 [Chrysochromulina tobinii]|uniref:Uncharacterized protein n=1 Tax=Chrysochromulina tobinii TaxID=1460289 RepID=A0A0M0JVA9_9EUKA|nr:hypothetical protein Ctob_006892 [Chrysochromulina tobinii]|eukprot:KOO30287.1 hypothetical protein Ctob_006892 [Chrysochromulina sp. CCMP291]
MPTSAIPAVVSLGAALMNKDPNSIFAVLSSRLGALELNQSITSDWLKLWQNQLVEKLRKLNASHVHHKDVVKGLQTETERLSLQVLELRSRFDEEGRGDVLQRVAAVEEASRNHSSNLTEAVDGLFRQLLATERRERQLRAEVDHMRLSHRIELMACMCLSLVLSSLLAVHCVTVKQQRSARRVATKAGGVGAESGSGVEDGGEYTDAA